MSNRERKLDFEERAKAAAMEETIADSPLVAAYEIVALRSIEKQAMSLLERAAEYLEERAPDTHWWKDYFLLTGQHMILTDEGWETPESKQSYLEEDPDWQPKDEVNAPKVAVRP